MLYRHMVLEDPLARRDHVTRPAGTGVVHDVERDERSIRRHAGVVPRRAGRNAGDEAAVTATVAAPFGLPEPTKLSCGMLRPAKSGRVVSMPESTIAIVGIVPGESRPELR